MPGATRQTSVSSSAGHLLKVLHWPMLPRKSGEVEGKMAEKKVVFVAFAIEDVRCRDYLKGQSLNTRSPFEYIDMSVKQAYDEEWKARVRTRIRRSDGVLVLVSKNSLGSSGQKWEVKCAREEGKPVRGMWCYRDDRTKVDGLSTMVWTWGNVANWIDGI